MVKLAAGFGDEDDGVFAIDESRIAEPIVADVNSLAVFVAQAHNGRFGDYHVGAFDDYDEAVGEKGAAVDLGSRAKAHLAEEFKRQSGVVDCFAQTLIIGGNNMIQVRRRFALGSQPFDSQFVAVVAAAPAEPGVAHLLRGNVVEESNGTVEFVDDDDDAGEVPASGQVVNEGDVVLSVGIDCAKQIMDVASKGE